jgi:hypothetical protein
LFGKKDKEEDYSVGFDRNSKQLPRSVKEPLDFLEAHKAYLIEGLFRVSGDLKQIYYIKKLYDKGNSMKTH